MAKKKVVLELACRHVLADLVNRYIKDQGASTAHLRAFRISRADWKLLEYLDSVEVVDLPKDKDDRVGRVWSEMLNRGWLENTAVDEEGSLALTFLGYEEATISRPERLRRWLNENQGVAAYLALVLSGFAIVFSGISLYFQFFT